MRRYGFSMIALAVTLALGVALSVSAAKHADAGVMGTIHAQNKAGKIGDARASFLKLLAHTRPDKLPKELRDTHPHYTGETGGPSELKCGVPAHLEARNNLDKMSDADRVVAKELLGLNVVITNPAKKTDTAGTIAGKGSTTTLVASTWPNYKYYVETANFVIYWGDHLTDEMGNALTLAADTIPDVISQWASYFEYSYKIITENYDFVGPTSSPYKVSVFIGNTDALTNRAWPISTYTYGYATYLLDTDNNKFPVVVVNTDYSVFSANGHGDWVPGRDSAQGAMKVTAAHELHHIFQFYYDPDIGVDRWIMEATSTWFEDEVFDVVNDYYLYLWGSGWFASPELPLDDSSQQYGTSIFLKYLSEHFADAGNNKLGYELVLDIWDRIAAGRTGYQAIGDITNTAIGWPLEDLYMGFAAANATMDYEEGESYLTGVGGLKAELPVYDSVSLSVDSDTAPSDGDTLPSEHVPDQYGAAYIKATVNSTGQQSLIYDSSLAETSPDVDNWGITLVHQPTAEGYALTFTNKQGSGIGLDCATAGDTVYAVPTYLASPGPGTKYRTIHDDPVATCGTNTFDTDPSSVVLVPLGGGLRAAWAAADDSDWMEGYIVRWKDTLSTTWSYKTVHGQVTMTWIGELDSTKSYDVEVAGYDFPGAVGNFVPATPATPTAARTSYPGSATIISYYTGAAAVTPTDGGGGGGCFINTL